MKKFLTILLLALLASGIGPLFAAKGKPAATAAAPASGQPFHKGAFFLGGALGLGSGLGYLGGVAVMANAEYGLTNEIGIGGSIGYWGYSESLSTFGATVKYSYTIIPIIVSGAYHIPIKNPKLDLAVGISLGYYMVSSSVESSISGFSYASATGSGVAWGVFGLARYFVSDSIALRGKLGYGITLLEVGVDFRF
ncbi:MAG: hypothetical protein U1F40_09625 [Turneriella sp.]|nr:hypothetical protein [Turneriella sp.]